MRVTAYLAVLLAVPAWTAPVSLTPTGEVVANAFQAMQGKILVVRAAVRQLRQDSGSSIDTAWSDLFDTINREGDKIVSQPANLTETDFDALKATIDRHTDTLDEVIRDGSDTVPDSRAVIETLRFCGKFRAAAQRATQVRMAFSSKFFRRVPETRLEDAKRYGDRWTQMVSLMRERYALGNCTNKTD
ncbi:hypothetical protein GQ602_003946 [Ophiocordyceps camponoti-floridani]|uniref:Secreted protein n=1 Tax=Ophiocordyceps camponoti-floridani TaxID=2030778 RepID=A0A8H4Q5Y9_9HYPO|nr:hypothetical protein GQ602_003946 [Ophiocordyceps camponoti-floridani]